MLTTMTFQDLTKGDTFDVRDVLDRFRSLELQRDNATIDQEGLAELHMIEAFLEEIAGYGGDEQFRGDWYPSGFIADDYFTEYAKQLADDIGAIDRHATWPLQYIDWETAARALQSDYSEITVNDQTFWYRG